MAPAASIPASEGRIGDIDDPGVDVANTVSAINGYLRADRDLSDTLRPQYIDYMLEETGTEPKNLWFEITESAFMEPTPREGIARGCRGS